MAASLVRVDRLLERVSLSHFNVGILQMQVLLFEVSPTAPAPYVVVALLLMTVATAATLVPARRAARVDPMVAMRAE